MHGSIQKHSHCQWTDCFSSTRLIRSIKILALKEFLRFISTIKGAGVLLWNISRRILFYVKDCWPEKSIRCSANILALFSVGLSLSPRVIIYQKRSVEKMLQHSVKILR